jgi:hypothetical protein
MSKTVRSGGINTQAGITAQNWAALSMFVQQTFDASFVKIQLEQAKLADFVLVFQNRRIICESKNYHISYADIKSILDTIPDVGPDDKIVIICKSVEEEVRNRLSLARHVSAIRDQLVEEKEFTDHHLELLPKLDFWEVDQSLNEEIVRNLMEQRFNIWLPNNNLVNATLVEKIFKQSARGGEFTKDEFIADVETYRRQLAENDDSSLKTKPLEERVKEVLSAIQNPTSRLASSSNPLQVLATDPNLHGAAFDVLKRMDRINLNDWDLFWQATYSTYFSRELFSVLKSRATSIENAEYAINFVQGRADSLRYKIYDEYQYKAAAELLETARKVAPSHNTAIVDLFIRFYRAAKQGVLFIKRTTSSSEWILIELSRSLANLYRDCDQSVGKKILAFIDDEFSLVEDGVSHWGGTPLPIFDILREDIGTDKKKLHNFIAKISRSYNKLYSRFTRRKPAFQGWELVGSVVANWRGEPHLEDRKFLEAVILPCLRAMQRKDAMQIIEKYAAYDAEEVSSRKPDFMNRASIPFLIEDYANGQNAEGSFAKLSALIKMRRGIPDKKEPLYQAVEESSMSADKKWRLLQVGLQEYGEPVSVFMDRVLWQLLDSGHKDALAAFSNLLQNDQYMARLTYWGSTIPETICRIIKNKDTFEQGISLLKTYVQGKHINALGSFDAYHLRGTVLALLEEDSEIGIELLKSLASEQPTDNQQVVFGATLRDLPETLRLKVYGALIRPLLQEAGSATVLASKLTRAETRENIVWFGEKLAEQHAYQEAIEIAEFFVKDPDPTTDNEQDTHIRADGVDSSITTVRGILPWVLRHFSTVGGKDYVPRVFELTQTLCNDETLYVRAQGLVVLESLVESRHKRMPNSDEWFMPYAIASKVENLALAMLRDSTNHYPALLKGLARVFGYMRTLNEDQALEVIDTLEHQDREIVKPLAGFIIFMAEFRYERFNDWPKDRGELGPYDPQKVKEKLKDLLLNGEEGIRLALASKLTPLPNEATDEHNAKQLLRLSFTYFTLLTMRYNHEVFAFIYRFISQYIDTDYDEAYKLWKALLAAEKPAIFAQAKSNGHAQAPYGWWPYAYNGSILLKVAEHDFVKFLEDLEFLLNYPEDVMIATDLHSVVDYLARAVTNQSEVDRIFKKLLKRNANFYYQYEAWQRLNGIS